MQLDRTIRTGVLALALVGLLAGPAQATDVLTTNDGTVNNSLCVGTDCTNAETFGFDTVRLKENNLRIGFDDTSASGSFPDNDWEITINDSINGGDEYFAITDVTAGNVPFKVEAAAGANALVVENGGNVGLGTADPAVDLHVQSGNTPALRLHQDTSSGFSAQSWDVAGNEASFFVRDVTNGSQLPFRIEPGADSNSLYIDDANNIGVGTSNPSAPVHVKRVTGGSATLFLLENDSAANFMIKNSSTGNIWAMNNSNSTNFIFDSQLGGVADGPEVMFEPDGDLVLSDNGGVYTELRNLSSGKSWFLNHGNGGDFFLSHTDTPGAVTVDSSGNLTATGTVSGSSSRTVKEDIAPVDETQILAAVEKLQIHSWKYKADEGKITHVGPMAEDFYAAFQLGVDERHISFVDTAGVALASIQALSRKNEELANAKDRLSKENHDLRSRLDRIESLLSLR